MTDGEKMLWCATFAHWLRETGGDVHAAMVEAYGAVDFARRSLAEAGEVEKHSAVYRMAKAVLG